MRVLFRGVRGSYPLPLRPEAVKRKISAVVQRLRVNDLESQESRELFLKKLPETLFGTVGGNTSCVEVRLKNNALLIFDCGSGLRALEADVRKRKESLKEIHIFFSHFHYDHLTGLPYFGFLFDSSVDVYFYSPLLDLKEKLEIFLKSPYHPVGLDVFSAKLHFVHLKGTKIKISNASISWILRNHPDECYAYAVEEDEKKVIYSTDTEITTSDFNGNFKTDLFFKKADAIILDGQYTLGESIEKNNWGHTSYSMAVDFALEHKIKRLFLFHHEPLYDDSKLEGILRSARWYCQRAVKNSSLFIDLAREDRELIL
ncbi:MAG: MBL fold metallo-hydrolase [Deltaproteobacteria bacterium]|nr:MBL fold metallo-hydrolase [Deltaproteobacteria bacterium]